MMRPAEPFLARATPLVEFLERRGAARVGHGRRTFLHHLSGTAAILERWGGDDRVCKAGLFHSVYGTERFRTSLVSSTEREQVQQAIGVDAERLVWLFCSIHRASLFSSLGVDEAAKLKPRNGGPALAATQREIVDLVWLFWANEIEQSGAEGHALRAAAGGRLSTWLNASEVALPAPVLDEVVRLCGRPRKRGPDVSNPSLATLLNSVDIDAFLDAWPERLQLFEGPVERLAGLVDYDFDALTKLKKNHTKAFFRSLDGSPRSVRVSAGQEKALYDAGFTIYFHNLRSPAIDEWVSTLDEELGLVRGFTRVAGFASRRGLGLSPHYDLNDNFVCQARGTKRWRLAPNTHVRYPTAGYTMGERSLPVHLVEAPRGFPDGLPPDHQTIDLRPGSVLFVPRGMWHDTQTVEEESLHFNVQSGLAMWKDAIEYVLTQTSALYAEDLRAPILRMFDGEATDGDFGRELKEKLQEAIGSVLNSDIAFNKAAFHRFVASRRRG
jgi:hypothetical protein